MPPCRAFIAAVSLFAGVWVSGCKDQGKISAGYATSHVAFLADAATADVEEVRHGLPLGADVLAPSYKTAGFETDLKAVHEALETARRKVQDLRLAKSTFFALSDPSGAILRNDQEQDRMAGKSLFGSYPALSAAKDAYTETTGSMPEASGVRAPRADGQWVAGAPVRLDGTSRGIYVTGWSWAAYAYRLEFSLRSQVRSELVDHHDEHEPLLYVLVVAGKAVYGAPVTPEITTQAVAALDPLSKTKGTDTFSQTLEITQREYGFAVKRVPALGPDIAIAVLRSET
jgi:hypothetical protein